MIIDQDTQFLSYGSIANAVGTALVGSQIDTAVAGTLDTHNLGLTIVVTTAIVAAGAGTLQFKLSTDTTAAISTSGSAIDELVSEVFTTSTSATLIPAGTILFQGLLPMNLGQYLPNKRYLGLLEVVGGNAITAGAVTAFLGMDIGRWAPTPIAAN